METTGKSESGWGDNEIPQVPIRLELVMAYLFVLSMASKNRG